MYARPQLAIAQNRGASFASEECWMASILAAQRAGSTVGAAVAGTWSLLRTFVSSMAESGIRLRQAEAEVQAVVPVSVGAGGAQSGGTGLLIPDRPSGLVGGQSGGLTVGEGASASAEAEASVRRAAAEADRRTLAVIQGGGGEINPATRADDFQSAYESDRDREQTIVEVSALRQEV